MAVTMVGGRQALRLSEECDYETHTWYMYIEKFHGDLCGQKSLQYWYWVQLRLFLKENEGGWGTIKLLSWRYPPFMLRATLFILQDNEGSIAPTDSLLEDLEFVGLLVLGHLAVPSSDHSDGRLINWTHHLREFEANKLTTVS